MKKQAKKRQHSIAPPKKAKIEPRWKRNYRDVFPARNPKKISQVELEYIADIMLEWVGSSPNINIFKEFLCYQAIMHDKMLLLAEKSEVLKDAVNETLQTIGLNRERKALERDPTGIAFRHMQGTYDPQWKSQEIHFNNLKAKANSEKRLTEEGKAYIEQHLEKIKVEDGRDK